MALGAGIFMSIRAQAPTQGGRGGGRGGAGMSVFTAADENKDGSVTRDELRAAFAMWVGASGPAAQDQLASAIGASFPQPTAPARAAQNQTPNPADVEKMR